MNQYADLIDPVRKQIMSADARYISRIDTDNPYMLALPVVRSKKEIAYDCTQYPGLPPVETYQQMSIENKLSVLQKLKNARIYLPYYASIEDAVDNALVDSYEHRVYLRSKRAIGQYTQDDATVPAYQYSEINEMSDVPCGFSIIGRSGCGKSTGINNVLRKYPRFIVHKPGTMEQHVQIPILLVETPLNSNFHDLYRQIGKALDKILGNASYVYRNELGRKGDDLATKFDKLCDIINIFHIGLLILDEIEHIDKKHIKSGTMDTFMSLSNRTGISVAAIGTKDAYEKLFDEERITRRMGNLINADSYCSSEEQVDAILNTLYSYLPEPCALTAPCLDTFYKESNGVIARIIKIFVEVAKKTAQLKNKGKSSEVTPKIIINASKKVLTAERYQEDGYLADYSEDNNYSEAAERKLENSSNKSNEPVNSTEPPKVNNDLTIRNFVKLAIHGIPGCNYTDQEIESALHKVMSNAPENDVSAVLSATITELERRKKAKVNKAVKKEQQNRAVADLQKLKDDMCISTETEVVS